MSGTGLVAVAIGAALGAWVRWGLAAALNANLPLLPLGTLTANLIGGLLIGVATEIFGRVGGLSEALRLFVITGFLGALTTFSTFSAEVVSLLERAHYGWAMTLASAHLFGSLLATLLGIASVRWLAS
jgi:CrcB protein